MNIQVKGYTTEIERQRERDTEIYRVNQREEKTSELQWSDYRRGQQDEGLKNGCSIAPEYNITHGVFQGIYYIPIYSEKEKRVARARALASKTFGDMLLNVVYTYVTFLCYMQLDNSIEHIAGAQLIARRANRCEQLATRGSLGTHKLLWCT